MDFSSIRYQDLIDMKPNKSYRSDKEHILFVI